jgi:hypothetical protein
MVTWESRDRAKKVSRLRDILQREVELSWLLSIATYFDGDPAF